MTLTVETHKPAYHALPENYLISLDSYSAISLVGEEHSKYLQGQVTCDVNSLVEEKLLYGAHCNAKGKVFSCFRLFDRNEQHLLFQPASTINKSIAELQKFGVFAKVTIATADDLGFLALVGKQAVDLLKSHFSLLPDNLSPTVQVGSTTLVYIAGKTDRYLIIDDQQALIKLSTSFSLPVLGSHVWDLLEITEGIPSLISESENEYVPQMLNMQAINGISFTKGCYLGQETVARMQYLGKNKKALFALSGNFSTNSSALIVEKQLGENWRKAGDITAVYQADDGSGYIQAVLNNDIDESINLRFKDQPESSLSIIDLPYKLNQE